MPPNEIPPSLLINLLQEAASDISRILAEAEISLKGNQMDTYFLYSASIISVVFFLFLIPFTENSADFISKNYVMLGKAIGVYARLLKGYDVMASWPCSVIYVSCLFPINCFHGFRTGCPTQDQFEKLCASNSHHPKTREMLEELLIQEVVDI